MPRLLIRALIREILAAQTEVKPSPIHGLGLFTAEHLPAGSVVRRHKKGFDKIYPKDYPRSLPPRKQKFFKQHASFDGRNWTMSGDDAIYMNHSNFPNLSVEDGEETPSKRDLVTTRDVDPGEELTMDYGEIGIDAPE